MRVNVKYLVSKNPQKYGEMWMVETLEISNLVFIELSMKKEDYLSILQQNVSPSVEKLGLGGNWIFQQDNDPMHSSKIVKEWLLYRTPKVLGHPPPQSLDLAVNEGKTKYMLSTCSYRPITILMRQSRNLFTLAPPLPPKMLSVWRSNVGSLLPTGPTMVSIGNWVIRPLSYNEISTLQDSHLTRAALWHRGMDAIKQRCSSVESIREKSPS